MLLRISVLALALLAAGCQRENAANESGEPQQAQLDAPLPETEPSRVFAPQNPQATAATGQLTVSMALRLPDAGASDAEPTDVLTLAGANGLIVEGAVTGAVSPATQVQGQTLRALLDIPVEEPRTLVYRVTRETKPDGGQGICGADAAQFVVVWEPAGPGDPVMKILGVTGGAPGAADSRACPMLSYRRT